MLTAPVRHMAALHPVVGVTVRDTPRASAAPPGSEVASSRRSIGGASCRLLEVAEAIVGRQIVTWPAY